MCDWSFARVFHASGPAHVVKRNHGARRFNTVVDLRRGDHKSISSQPRTGPQRRTGKLENIRITQNPRILPLVLRRRYEHPHRRGAGRDVNVLASKQHGRMIHQRLTRLRQ